MATNKSLALTSSDGVAFSVDADKVVYAYNNANTLSVLVYTTSKGVNSAPITLTISTAVLQALATQQLFIETVTEADGKTKAVCFNNANVIKLNDVAGVCNMSYFINKSSANQMFVLTATSSTVNSDCKTTIPLIDYLSGLTFYANAYRMINITGATESGLVLQSAVDVAAGTGHVTGDVLTLAGGTFDVAAKVTVANTNLRTLALNAAGTGYAINDTIVLNGGTHSTAVILTVNTIGGGGAISTFTITNRGVYTVNTATFTQASTSGIGTGATFQTATWGVNTVTVSTPGVYTVAPTNPTAQGASTGAGTGATFTTTFALGAISGAKISYNDETNPTSATLNVEETKAAVTALINAL